MKKTAIISIGLMCLMTLTILAPVASAATAPVWTYGFPLGAARSQAVVTQTDNGVVYVIGGVNVVYTAVTTVSAFNPATGTWINMAPLLTATRGACGGNGSDGNIYVFDGTSSATQIYDVAGNSWSYGTAMPSSSNFWEAKCAIKGNHAYVFGGEDSISHERTTWIYNMTTDSWWSGADMPYGVTSGAVVSDYKYAYYFGGENVSGVATTNVSRYDFAADSWSRLAPLPSALCAEAAVIGPDGLIYVFGGANTAANTGMASLYVSTFVYDRTTNSWSTLDDMNVPRAWLGAAVYDNKILSVGGNDKTTIFTTVESYDTLPSQLNQLQKQLNDAKAKLDQTVTLLNTTSNDVSALQGQVAVLQNQIANLTETLNETVSDLNDAIDAANNNANNKAGDAQTAADSANMMALIGVMVGIVGIVIAIVAVMMAMKKGKGPQQMVPQQGQVQQ